MKIFASHNPDSEIRHLSSSGGIFTLLAQQVLRQGGVVYGAAFAEDWTVIHRRVDTEAGLGALRGSKYIYSNVGTAYSDAIADLEAGLQVLFSGTPCQIAAMRKRAGYNQRLYLVEIVCHGAPRPEYWQRYLVELCQKCGKKITDIASINFRDKNTGWKHYSFTIRFHDGKVFSQLHHENLYMRAFLHDFTLREACFKCPFKYPDGSRADITIGDLWGISQLAPEIDNDLGTTLVITQRNIDDFLNADAELTFKNVVQYNPAIVTHANSPSNRASFIKAAQNGNLIPVLKRFAARPPMQKIYLKLARLKHKLIR